METAIYFNLVAFSALKWYNLEGGANRVAAAYTSIIVIFILLLGSLCFMSYTTPGFTNVLFVKKAFKWKLIDKNQGQLPPNNALEKLDGYQFERSAAGGQRLPTVL